MKIQKHISYLHMITPTKAQTSTLVIQNPCEHSYTCCIYDALIFIVIGLDTLCCYLRKGEDAEKRLVLGIVLDIVSDTEALRLVKVSTCIFLKIVII